MTDEALRILVVDDEFGMREGCRRILSAEGYDVTTAEDGLAAVDALRSNGAFAAIVLDLKMPRMGGIELIEHVRQTDQDVVLLVITAYATIETAVEATRRGANGYIAKPFTPDELLLHVRNGLERRTLLLEAKRLREERERRLLEVAFERSKTNTIINCMTDGVLVVNRDRQIVLQNAAANRLFPSSAGHPLPAPLDAALESPDLRTLLTRTLEAGSGPLVASQEITLGACPYMVNVSPVTDAGGETLGAVAVLRDIAPLKKLEAAKSVFVSMVAHGLKNHIGAVEGYLNLIVSGLAGEDPKRDHEMMQRALMRITTLRQMIAELTGLSAMETGHFTITRAPMDFMETLQEALQLYTPKADEKRIALSLHAPPPESVPRILADRNAVHTILTNLLDNAIKYTPPGGRVTVTVECDRLHVRVRVRDTGIGIAPEDQEKIFDDFYRVRNEQTADIVGTGLGLSIVKRLASMHHGAVTLASAPGQGSEFTVALPRLEQNTEDSR